MGGLKLAELAIILGVLAAPVPFLMIGDRMVRRRDEQTQPPPPSGPSLDG